MLILTPGTMIHDFARNSVDNIESSDLYQQFYTIIQTENNEDNESQDQSQWEN